MPSNKKKPLLEREINKCNLRYRLQKIAFISKQELPLKLTKRGSYVDKSTVDYLGVYDGGKAIAFDAKEVGSTTSLPLTNIHEHQLNFLKCWKDAGGVAFFLVWFYKLDSKKAYILPVDIVWKFWQNTYTGGRKSIPIEEFHNLTMVPIEDYLCGK